MILLDNIAAIIFRKLLIYFITNVTSVCSCHSVITQRDRFNGFINAIVYHAIEYRTIVRDSRILSDSVI